MTSWEFSALVGNDQLTFGSGQPPQKKVSCFVLGPLVRLKLVGARAGTQEKASMARAQVPVVFELYLKAKGCCKSPSGSRRISCLSGV